MAAVKTGLLFAGLIALFATLGSLVGGYRGLIVGLLISSAFSIYTYWTAHTRVIRRHGGQAVDPHDPLARLTADLAQRAGIPMPKLYLLPTDQPNAFATGRSPETAAVAVSRGLLDRCSSEEVAGVVAHELAHIKHRDTLLMTVSATLVAAFASFARFGLLFRSRRMGWLAIIGVILAPVAAMILQFAISRQREYAADRAGAEICGDPVWLAAALRSISNRPPPMPSVQANPGTASLFIMNPLTGGVTLSRLFSTHPPMDERIRRLYAMAGVPAGVGPAPVRRP